MMKKVLLLMAVLALASCQFGNKGYDPKDALSFGLVGDVKEVYVTRSIVSTDSENDAVEEGMDEERLEMTFTEKGRITLDTYGNPYVYDEEGKFVKGFTENTVLVRDNKGRLETYDNMTEDYDGDFDVETYFTYTFSYDDQDRVILEELGGWEWGETYYLVYSGKKTYPVSATFTGYNENWNEEGTIEYEYISFDDRGNWTERKQIIDYVGYEEDCEDEAENHTTVYLQKRRIIYWDL